MIEEKEVGKKTTNKNKYKPGDIVFSPYQEPKEVVPGYVWRCVGRHVDKRYPTHWGSVKKGPPDFPDETADGTPLLRDKPTKKQIDDYEMKKLIRGIEKDLEDTGHESGMWEPRPKKDED